MDIFVPKIKEIFMSHDSQIIAPKTRIRGKVKCVLRGSDGRIKQETPWQENLITNTGLAELRYNDWMIHLILGSGTTPPAITDTEIESYLGDSSGDHIAGSGTNSGSPDYIRKTVKEYVFANGEATGTITELGFSPKDTAAPYKLCTHLLLNTPIVKGPNDHLTVTYQLFLHPSTADVTGVISISGEDFNYTMRGSNWDAGFDYSYPNHPYFGWITPDYRNRFFDGGIGTIEGYPSGNALGLGGASVSYGGSFPDYYSDIHVGWGIDDNNGSTLKSFWGRLPWGLSVLDSWATAIGWQVEIGRVADGPDGLAGTGIFKRDTHVCGLTARMFSDRYP